MPHLHPPFPPHTRDKRSEFFHGNPPEFSQPSNPLVVDDWLRAVERQLEIAQCNDREKVLYGTMQLRGDALDWWEAYLYVHTNRDAIT